MATAQQQKPSTLDEDRAALERVLTLPISKKAAALDDALVARIEKIEGLLPDYMKGQGARLVRRAMLTFSKTPKLQECSPPSIVQCVLEAAELGYAIDGRLCHAVPYNNKKKDKDGNEYWVMEAQCQVDYKGLIAAAKRSKAIQDCWARIVREHDTFDLYEENGKTQYKWKPCLTGDVGTVLGVVSVATHKDGWYRVDFMPIAEIDAIKARSKSAKGFSPWKTDESEMQKKTSLRRLLKTFSDDQGLVRLFEIDDQDFPPHEPYIEQIADPAGATKRILAGETIPFPATSAAAGRSTSSPKKEPETERTTETDQAAKEADHQESLIEEAERLFGECDGLKHCRALRDNYIGPDSKIQMTDEDAQDIEAIYQENLKRFVTKDESADESGDEQVELSAKALEVISKIRLCKTPSIVNSYTERARGATYNFTDSELGEIDAVIAARKSELAGLA